VTDRKPRTFLLDSLESLNKLAATTGLPDHGLSDLLGYGRNTVHGWRRANAMPLVAAKLCRAMIAQPGRTGAKAVVMVVVNSPAQADAVKALARGLGQPVVCLPLGPDDAAGAVL
jgi:hypothetical protein